MTFITFKFLHVAFMFMGVALGVGPAVLLGAAARSGDAAAIGRTFALTERIFQVSTVCYGLGIASGLVAAVLGTIDLTASWLITAYVLVAALGAVGTLFDRWTKRVASGFGPNNEVEPLRLDGLCQDRTPTYLLTAMVALVVAIVYVMVTKVTFF